jgi:hypothetical protein
VNVLGSELVRISGSKKIVPPNGGVSSTFGIDGSVSLGPQEIKNIRSTNLRMLIFCSIN